MIAEGGKLSRVDIGFRLMSQNRIYWLQFQEDGNLAIIEAKGRLLWASNWVVKPMGNRLGRGDENNLLVHGKCFRGQPQNLLACEDKPWLQLQGDDGNLVIYCTWYVMNHSSYGYCSKL